MDGNFLSEQCAHCQKTEHAVFSKKFIKRFGICFECYVGRFGDAQAERYRSEVLAEC